jgi:hypothetical protein
LVLAYLASETQGPKNDVVAEEDDMQGGGAKGTPEPRSWERGKH